MEERTKVCINTLPMGIIYQILLFFVLSLSEWSLSARMFVSFHRLLNQKATDSMEMK